VTPLGDGDWLVDGRLPVEEADEGLGMDLPSSDEYETLAGWVLAELGHIPVAGETLRHGDWLVRVANVRRRRVARLRVTRETASEQAPEE
jgi:putative hemolysin